MTVDALWFAFQNTRKEGFAPGPGTAFWQRHDLTMAVGEFVFISDWPVRSNALAQSISNLINDNDFKGRTIFWRVYGGDPPDDVAALLSKAGFLKGEEGTLMGQDLRNGVPDRSESGDVRRIDNVDQLAAFDRVVASAFNRELGSPRPRSNDPRLSYSDTIAFLAYCAGIPVGVGLLDHVNGATTCHLRAGGVIAEYRRRGFYEALTFRRLNEAIKRGAQIAFSDSNHMSQPRLAEMGFKSLRPETLWTLSPRRDRDS